jgi:UDP-N-acetylmuramate dehydrogenase
MHESSYYANLILLPNFGGLQNSDLMQVQKNVALRHLNTFGLESRATFFVDVHSDFEVQQIIRDPEWKDVRKFILGGGSNILLLQDLDALVIHTAIEGIKTIREDDAHIWLHVGGGVVWHEFVMYCVENGYGGVENLSLIPGTVGAAPLQNIGAYGVEVKEVVESVDAVLLTTGALETFTREQCRFGYRESIFKNELKGQYFITGVTFRLNKKPDFKVQYGDIQRTLDSMGVTQLSIRAISDAVIHIRRSKLPDPAEIGNAGSFFKNPEISRGQYEKLQISFPAIPGYIVNEETMKVPAGWLIEQAGWKGHRQGAIGVHERQALVLVNYGGGTGLEIKELSKKIQTSIFEKFGIALQAEVNFV